MSDHRAKSKVPFDEFENLKISALTNAARISPYCHDITLGPSSVFWNSSPEPAIKSLAITVKNTKEKEVFDPWKPKVTLFCKPPRTERSVKVIDFCNEVSSRVEIKNQEKLREEFIKKEVALRQAKIAESSRRSNEILKDNIAKSKISIFKQHRDHEARLIQQVEEEHAQARLLQEAQRKENERKFKDFDRIRKSNLLFVNSQKSFYIKVKLKDPHHIIYKKCEKSIIEYNTRYDKLIELMRSGHISETEVKLSEKLCKDMETLNIVFDTEYDNICRLNDAAAAAVQEEKNKNEMVRVERENQRIAEAAKIEQAKANLLNEQKLVTATNTVETPINSVIVVDAMSQFVAHDRFEYYKTLKQLYEEYTASVRPLLDDDNLKKYRFDCQKAINIPINAISAVTSQHLTDKYEKLAAILSGNVVKIGDTSVSAESHPLGRQYCTLLIAKKFVSQADTMIASNVQAAYPIAACLVALWQKFPDLGKLFLFNMYKECPYLVPYFIPQLEGQNMEDYVKSLGYRYSEGVIEKQDMYLKRMKGIARLYSAVLISRPRRNETTPNPHNIENGWNWITNLLNLDPIPDICSTLILEFLQTAGAMCFKVYGKQFIKLLKSLQDQYFIKLNQVDEGGPKARLEAFLLTVFKEGKIEQPEGILSHNFW